MARMVKIPSTPHPFVCVVNNKAYMYANDIEVEVPNEVANLIDVINASKPQESKYAGDWDEGIEGIGANLSVADKLLKSQDTTYAKATTTKDGLMAKEDKTKLNNIPSSFLPLCEETTEGIYTLKAVVGESGTTYLWATES